MSRDDETILTLEMIRRAKRALEDQPFPSPTSEACKAMAEYFESQYFRAWLLASTFEVSAQLCTEPKV